MNLRLPTPPTNPSQSTAKTATSKKYLSSFYELHVLSAIFLLLFLQVLLFFLCRVRRECGALHRQAYLEILPILRGAPHYFFPAHLELLLKGHVKSSPCAAQERCLGFPSYNFHQF